MRDLLSSQSPQNNARLVILGRNSVLWSRIADRVLAQRPTSLAIGHSDLDGMHLSADDHLWILSYAPREEDNRLLFEKVRRLGAGRHFYLSSATVNIAEEVGCYRYPAVKAAGERDAKRVLDAATIRIGLIYDDPTELPAGVSAATRLEDLVGAILAPDETQMSDGGITALYQMIERPFGGVLENAAYRAYGGLIRLFRWHPCLLRPIDLVLRYMGFRWYGYFRLSNDRCITTI